jgi:hypothetical protein
VATESDTCAVVREIALADDYVPSWVAVIDIAPVGRSPVGECAKFPFRLPLRTLGSDLIGFQTLLHVAAIPTRQRPLHPSSSVRRSTKEYVRGN